MKKILAFLASCFAFAAASAFAAPNQAPTVSITSPASGASYNSPASVTFTANAHDSDGTVTKVEYFDGTVSIGQATVSPYTVTWNTAVSGTHSITAKATDNGNKVTTSAAIQVRIVSVTTFVTSPPNNAVVQTGFVSVSGTFSGPDTTSVIVTAGAGHSVVAGVSAGAFGANVLVGRGLNNIEVQVARRDGTSETVTSRVTGIGAPVVALVAPTLWGPYTAPAAVTLTAEATSPDAAIDRVVFYDAFNAIGTAPSAPYSFTATLTGTGDHAIFARAYDVYGFFTDSRTIVVKTQSQPPTVSITSPAPPNLTFRTPGTVALAATASDPDGTVSRVEYFYGSIPIPGAPATPPYSVSWVNPPVGSFDLTARATDNSNAYGYSQPVHVNIVSNILPTVDLVAPAAEASFRAPATISFSANAADSDGTVSKVEFLLNGNVVATANSSPWNATNPIPIVAGSYDLTARATDNDGGAGYTTTSRHITVAANAQPTVSITSPLEGATFNAPVDIAITANAGDSDGSVTQVEFFAGTTSLGVSPPPSFGVTWANAPVGSHDLTAKATDNEGATKTSAIVHITVNGLTSTILAPANGASYVAPAAFDVTARVSTSSGSITSIEFYDGAAKLQTFTPGPGIPSVTATLNLSAVVEGTHVYTVKGFDSGGRTATSTAITVNVTPAPAPPTVALSAPRPNALYLAPALVRVTANATAGSSPISKVEFFANASSIATLTTPPFEIAWSNVATGSYNLTATVTDTANVAVTSTPVSIVVSAAPSASVAPGLDGSTVAEDTVFISGTLQAPSNSAVSVNGALATLTRDGRFFVNNLLLQPGSNTIPISVQAQDGQTSTQSINITSSGASGFRIQITPQEGVAPLNGQVTVQYVGTAAIGSVDYDFDDDGSVEVSVPSVSIPVTWQLPDPGVMKIRATVKDPQGAILYSAVRWVYAEGAIDRADRVAGVHNDTMDRLSIGNIDGAVNLFSPQAADKYRSIFTQLGSNLAAAVSQFGRIEHVIFADQVAQLVVVRSTPLGPEAFMVTLMRGTDGIWRIDGM